jgi:hypothetical protein
MGVEFTFFDYVDESGENVIRAWLKQQGTKVEARFDGDIRTLEAFPPEQWRRPYVAKLKGECAGLIEIRRRILRVQYRLLGFYGPNDREVTLVVGAIEKDRKWVPLTACETGLRRKYEVLVDPITHRRRHGFR